MPRTTNSAESSPSSSPDSKSPGKVERSPIKHRNPQVFLTAAAVIARARDELSALTGYKVDNVSGFEKKEDGWRITVTVVELRRIPCATDVLATYEATLNEAGDILSYHRAGRYFRDQVGVEQ
jgi:hypothetical protein